MEIERKSETSMGKSIRIQDLLKRIEQNSGYDIIEMEHIWNLLKLEMVRSFMKGQSVNLGEEFGCMKTSIFVPSQAGVKGERGKGSRFQVRFQAGKILKQKLEIK